jgi:pimeloyl-ACP methyl ester carboxylesterase
MAPVLARIRTIDGWARIWQGEAEGSAARGDFRRAASQAFLGHLPLSPHHPRKAPLLDLLRRCHLADRQAQGGFRSERVRLAGGGLVGYWETPHRSQRPPVLLMPPLASTKEELAVLADPLLGAGHPVLRLDLPGQGESPPPLPIQIERLLRGALDELGVTPETGCFAGGISLGAHCALRLAGADGARVRGVFGISPPAIITPEQWRRQEEIIWQYLDIYFATASRGETRRLCLCLTLDDMVSRIACPVLLFHAIRDPISLPDKVERYRAALSHVPLSDHLLEDFHGCTLHLKNTIAPHVVAWCAAATPGARQDIAENAASM